MTGEVYAYAVDRLGGGKLDLAACSGKVLLIVNTASECGFTPQYDGLEKLWQDYRDRGLVVLGFPCNQFGGQEPGTPDEIGAFCQKNYGVTFPLAEKIDVNGHNAVLSKKQNRQLSGCLAIVVVEHSTQSLSLLDRTIQ